jgi:hypothetical protein
VKVANNKPLLFQILGASPGAPRAAIFFVNEIPRSQFADVGGKMDRNFWVVVSRGIGFNPEAGMSLTEGVAGGRPMFELAEEAREIVRGIRLEDQGPDDNKPVYKGIFPIEFEGVTVDALYVDFTLSADTPEQS